MPASPNDNDLKKQALMKMIGNSQPQMDTIFGVNQPKVPWKQAYESMGMSGAPLSQLQGTSALFAPANAKYNGLGGVSDNKMGYVSPTAGQPALNRAGGPLDVSPAGVAGEATSLVADPRNYMAPGLKTGMAGVSKLEGQYPNLKRLLQPEEYMEMVKNDPDVQELMSQEALRGTVPTPEQEASNQLGRNKAIIKISKESGEDTVIPDENDEDNN